MNNKNFYMKGSTIPKSFLSDDKMVVNQYMNNPIPITKSIDVKVPFIEERSNKKPLIITDDWYIKQKKASIIKQAKDSKITQIEIMQILANRDVLRGKLGKLDPSNKRDSKKIVAINIQLKDLEAELKMLQELSGIDINQLDHGTRLGRFVGRFHRIIRKAKKKIKKFYKNNKELINGLSMIILPTIGSFIIKGLMKLFI